MVTFVGTEANFIDTLKNLIELDYAAIQAYGAAIERVENTLYQGKLAEFKEDHQRHIKEVSELLIRQGETPPEGPSAKQWLTQGKVVLANLIGDKMILTAMHSNELDTNKAYETALSHSHKLPDSIPVMERALEDERRHKAWIEDTLEADFK